MEVSFADAPDEITRHAADCLWVVLAEREAPRPLAGQALQWVDWKLHGSISRHLLRGPGKDAVTTFVPTMKRVAFGYVALAPADGTDWKAFLRNCEGMRMKDVLVVCEDPQRLASVEKEFRKLSVSEYPQRVMFGVYAMEKG
jgi:hypothetical protein